MEQPENFGLFDAKSEVPWNLLKNAWNEVYTYAQLVTLQKTPAKEPYISNGPSEHTADIETSSIEDIVQRVRAKPLDVQLKYLMRYFKRLDAVSNACEIKLRGIQNRARDLDLLKPSGIPSFGFILHLFKSESISIAPDAWTQHWGFCLGLESPAERSTRNTIAQQPRISVRGFRARISDAFLPSLPSEDSSLNSETKTSTALDDIVLYAQRIASHLRAPPEYSDPTGTDPYCVPGYFFPCPDTATMRRSSLFYTHLPRAMPPAILLKEDAATPSVYWITLSTETHRAQILYAINQSTTWNLYNEERKPYITAPGNYVIHSYCQATGHLVSETAVSQINLSPRAALQSQVLHHTRKPLDWVAEAEGCSKKRRRTNESSYEEVSESSGPVNAMNAQTTTQLVSKPEFSETELPAELTQSLRSTSNTETSGITKERDEKIPNEPQRQDVQIKEPSLTKTKPSGLGRFSGLFLSTGETKNDSDSQSDSEASEDG